MGVVFIAGLIFFTTYSQSYIERQKPFVEIALTESGTLYWSYETRSLLEPANEEVRERGYEWVFNVLVPRSEFKEYMNELGRVSAQAHIASNGFSKPIQYLNRNELPNGDMMYLFGYVPHREVWSDAEATILLERDGPLSYDTLVPLTAVHFDEYTGEYYLFTLARRDGAWGREYVAVRQTVVFGIPQRVGVKYNVMPGAAGFGPIVIASERPLINGELVRIFN